MENSLTRTACFSTVLTDPPLSNIDRGLGVALKFYEKQRIFIIWGKVGWEKVAVSLDSLDLYSISP